MVPVDTVHAVAVVEERGLIAGTVDQQAVKPSVQLLRKAVSSS